MRKQISHEVESAVKGDRIFNKLHQEIVRLSKQFHHARMRQSKSRLAAATAEAKWRRHLDTLLAALENERGCLIAQERVANAQLERRIDALLDLQIAQITPASR